MRKYSDDEVKEVLEESKEEQKIVTFMQRFCTWACVTRCDSALDSEIIVKTSRTPLAELERLHDCTLVNN